MRGRLRRDIAGRLAEEVDGLVRALGTVACDPRAVHAARVAIKRLRSGIRLLEPWLPERLDARLRGGLRRLAGILAPARDAESLLATWERIGCAGAGLLPPERCAAVHAELAGRQRVECDRLAPLAGRTAAAAAGIFATVDWAVRPTPAGLWDRLGRAYRRARRAWKAAETEPRPDAMHAWRKRVKDLHHACRLLRRMDRPALRRWKGRWGGLADRLGDLHDLDLLAAWVRREPVLAGPCRVLVLRRIGLDAEALRRDCLHRGGRLLAAAAGRHLARLRG